MNGPSWVDLDIVHGSEYQRVCPLDFEIKRTAENDLARRYAQIETESSQNAANWYLRVIEAIEKLDKLAERCPIVPEDLDIRRGFRHLIIGDYRVLYVIKVML